jgi:hypothetical protein
VRTILLPLKISALTTLFLTGAIAYGWAQTSGTAVSTPAAQNAAGVSRTTKAVTVAPAEQSRSHFVART